MKLIKTKIKNCYLIQLDKFKDKRGFFTRAFCKNVFDKENISNNFSKIIFSFSKKKGTIRGLHFQIKPFEK